MVQYQDNYLEAFFQDGTSMAWQHTKISYYSLKGNKIKLSLDSLHHSPDASAKVAQIVSLQNRYNDEYIELPVGFVNDYERVLKKYKIK